MDRYKQDIFQKEYNKELVFETLPIRDAICLIEEVGMTLSLDLTNYSTQKCYVALRSILPNKLLSETSSFKKIMKALGIDHLKGERVYLIWSIYNEVDQIAASELNKYWDIIWQPPSDDALMIFIPDFKKILLITHYQCIYYH